MAVGLVDEVHVETNHQETLAEARYEKWAHWPVNWSGIWTGTLAAVAALILFGLVGVAVGAQLLGPENRVVDLKKIGITTLAFSVFSSFLAFVIGGWVAGKVAGILRSEPAMLHGAIVWLTTVPFLVGLTALGAGSSLGAWSAGMVASSGRAGADVLPFERPEQPGPGASETEVAQYRSDLAEYRQQVRQWREDTPKVARNTALGTITALLLGLIGGVVGGWMASGEPMTLTYHRNRPMNRLDSSIRV